jgi:hypothetical protein
MRKISLFLLIFALVINSLVVFVRAQEYKQEQRIELPPGMELIQVGANVFVVAPKGSKVRQEDTRIIVERTNAYMMRRFQDIEDRLTQLKAEQEQLKKEIEKIKISLLLKIRCFQFIPFYRRYISQLRQRSPKAI